MPDPSTTPASTTPETPAPAAAPAAETKPGAGNTAPPAAPQYDEDTRNATQLREFIKGDPELRKAVKSKWYKSNNLPTPKDDPDFADEAKPETKPDAPDPNEAVFAQLADQAFFSSIAAGDPVAGEAKWHKEYGPYVDHVLNSVTRGKKDLRTARMQMLGFLKEYADLRMAAAAKTQQTQTETPETTETSGERSTGGGGASPSSEPKDIYEAFRQAKKEHGVTRLAELIDV